MGGILIRAGLETAADYSYAEGPDTSRVVLDVLMNQGSDWSYLEKLYDRMTDVEKALEGMAGDRYPDADSGVTSGAGGRSGEECRCRKSRLTSTNGRSNGGWTA